MRVLMIIQKLILIILTFFFSSCTREEGDFTAGNIAIFITAAFVVGVIFYFLIRKQAKRKGDNNRKP